MRHVRFCMKRSFLTVSPGWEALPSCLKIGQLPTSRQIKLGWVRWRPWPLWLLLKLRVIWVCSMIGGWKQNFIQKPLFTSWVANKAVKSVAQESQRFRNIISKAASYWNTWTWQNKTFVSGSGDFHLSFRPRGNPSLQTTLVGCQLLSQAGTASSIEASLLFPSVPLWGQHHTFMESPTVLKRVVFDQGMEFFALLRVNWP